MMYKKDFRTSSIKGIFVDDKHGWLRPVSRFSYLVKILILVKQYSSGFFESNIPAKTLEHDVIYKGEQREMGKTK